MDVTTYITPPGFHLLEVAGTLVDGLAELFSDLADAKEVSDVRKTGAFLFSVAERGVMTARCADDLLCAENTAVEALQTFNTAGDIRSAALCARLVVHALRAQASACPPGHVDLRAHCSECFLHVATAFLGEELARADLHGNNFAKALLSLLCLLLNVFGSFRRLHIRKMERKGVDVASVYKHTWSFRVYLATH